MKSYLDLIPISAKVHKRQNRMTLICIILSVFLVTVIFGMAQMEIQSQQLQEIKKDGNWHVKISGITDQDATLISARPQVKAYGWYALADKKDTYSLEGKTAMICGLDPAVFNDILPITMSEGSYPDQKDGAVLTENAKTVLGIQVGDTIKIQASSGASLELLVTGFCKSNSILMKADAYGILMTNKGFQSVIPQDNYNNQFLVQLSTYCNMQKVIADITQQFNLTGKQVSQNGNLLGALGQSQNSFMLQLYKVAAVLSAIVLLAGVLMITSSLNSNVLQRMEFFGMMRCLGATKKQVMRFVRREGLEWCKIAVPLGLAMGTVVVWILCAVLKILSPTLFAEMPTFGISWISLLSGFIVGILAVLFAASSPAKKAAHVSPLAAVSGNANSAKTVRTAANTAFFQVDTALGIHHAISNKKNFALIIGSFALSIVLFLSFSATIDFMNHAVSPLKPWSPDISIISADNTCSIPYNLTEKLQNNSKIKRVYGRMFAYHISVKADGKERIINLISYENNQFLWVKNNLLKGSLYNVEKGDQILIDYDKRTSLSIGDSLIFDREGQQKKIKVAGILSSSPIGHEEGVDTVICSEETFKELTGKSDYTVIDIQLAKEATDEDVNAIRNLAGSQVEFSDQRLSNREAKGAYLSFALFIYGFLVVIALITIFNIVNTVAMSFSSRIRQYGAMRAIGMSDHQLVKMVMAETVTYAVVGSIIGSMIGIYINKILFEKMVTFHWGDPWQIPFAALGMITAIVIITSIFAVHGPTKYIHNMSIVDTISAQ